MNKRELGLNKVGYMDYKNNDVVSKLTEYWNIGIIALNFIIFYMNIMYQVNDSVRYTKQHSDNMNISLPHKKCVATCGISETI